MFEKRFVQFSKLLRYLKCSNKNKEDVGCCIIFKTGRTGDAVCPRSMNFFPHVFVYINHRLYKL